MTDLPLRCGYCNRTPEQWVRSPHGRPYCPSCGAIPAAYQRTFEQGSPVVTSVNHD